MYASCTHVLFSDAYVALYMAPVRGHVCYTDQQCSNPSFGRNMVVGASVPPQIVRTDAGTTSGTWYKGTLLEG